MEKQELSAESLYSAPFGELFRLFTSGIEPESVAVLLRLICEQKQVGENIFTIARETISQDLSMSLPKVRRHINELAKLGVIIIHSRGFATPTSYQISNTEIQRLFSGDAPVEAEEKAVSVKESGKPAAEGIIVDTLAHAFLENSKIHSPTHYQGHRTTVSLLLKLYAGVTVEDFSPKCLAAVQLLATQQVVKTTGKPYSRQFCNIITQYIKQMFRWGVAEELVPAAIAEALNYVQPLRRGRTDARETIPRQHVSNEIVDATLAYLLPIVAVMVQVQRLAVMRPNEICRMRPCDIDMSREDGIWLYRPPDHKGAWRGHGRIIPLGEQEQVLLSPYIKLAEAGLAGLETPLFINQSGNQYISKVYAEAVSRGIEQANRILSAEKQIPRWTPYQLRHAGVTELVFENDGNLDVARAVAGQRSLAVTQGYNHADLKIAIEQAKKRSKSGQLPAEPLLAD